MPASGSLELSGQANHRWPAGTKDTAQGWDRKGGKGKKNKKELMGYQGMRRGGRGRGKNIKELRDAVG